MLLPFLRCSMGVYPPEVFRKITKIIRLNVKSRLFFGSVMAFLYIRLCAWDSSGTSLSQLFFLFEYFEYAPKARTASNSQCSACYVVLNRQACQYECDACNCEHRPAACAEMIFTLDDDGMKDAY